MKELKPLVGPAADHKPNIRIRKISKRWKSSLTVSNGRDKNINFMVELYYKQLLEFAKSVISTLPDTYSRTVFEKDYREDNTENCFTMHSFITPNFYLYLECDFAYCYRVEYDFYNCPFEDQIRAKFETMATMMKYSKQRHLQPNCDEYLKSVFKVQDEKYRLVL